MIQEHCEELWAQWPLQKISAKAPPRGFIISITSTRDGKKVNFMRTLYDFSKRLFATKHLPDAIMASNDQGAIGIFNAAHEFNLKIPQDLAVTGYDDDDLGSYPAFNLTTARQEVEKSCTTAVELLMEQIQSGKSFKKAKVFFPTLVLRNSCSA